LHLGEVWAQPDFRAMLPLRNHSEQEIEIVRLGCTPCGCCRFEPATLVVPPHEERHTTVVIDLGPRNEREAHSPQRDFRMNVTVTARGDKGPPRTWELSAKIRSAVSLSPARLDFAQSLIQGAPPPVREVAVRSHVPLANLVVGDVPDVLEARLERHAGAPSQYRLLLKPKEPLIAGAFDATVVLKPTLADGRRVPPVICCVAGEVQANIQAFPSSVSFGQRHRGEAAEQLVVLRSHTGEPFEVAEVRCASPDLRVEAVDDPMAGRARASRRRSDHQFRLRLSCMATGRFVAQTTFVIRATKTRQPAVAVPIWAHISPGPGDAPKLTARATDEMPPSRLLDRKPSP
jgi:hypothetical protein